MQQFPLFSATYFAARFSLLTCMYYVYTLTSMSEVINFRATDEDRKILAFLKKKLGLSTAGVIRLAIRFLRDKQIDKRK